VLIVDDADLREAADLDRLDRLRQRGARLVLVVSSEGEHARLPGATFALYQVPGIDPTTAAALVSRMIPSLSNKLVRYLVARAGGLPGLMRAAVDKLEGKPVVSIEDVESHLGAVP